MSSHSRWLASPVLTAILAISASGCLKTRAQLRQNEDAEAATPRQVEVQSVQPKGEYIVDEMRAEITRMTGRIEDLERQQKQNEAGTQANAQAKEEIRKLETRIVELEQAQAAMLTELKKLQAAAPAREDIEHFAHGKKEFKSKNYSEAIEALSQYLKAPKAKHQEEATFLRAEAYFHLKQYKKAIIDYSKFPEKFSSSKHMPAALFKIGQSFESLGMKDDAKGFYQELVEKFPKSAEAAKARKKAK